MNEKKRTRGDIVDRSFSDDRIAGGGSIIVATRKPDPVPFLPELRNPEMPRELASSS